MKRTLKFVGITLLVLFLLRLISIFFFPWYVVMSDSMSPTMNYGDHFFVSSYHYRLEEPHRNDIAAFLPHEEFKEDEWVHRIIGVPGDRVVIQDGRVLVNGEEILFPILTEAEDVDIVVSEGKVFQKGDHPNTLYGLVSQDLLVGKVILYY